MPSVSNLIDPADTDNRQPISKGTVAPGQNGPVSSDLHAPIVLKDLFGPDADLDSFSWCPFLEGVEILQIYGSPGVGPSAALLRYQSGASIPTHLHAGFEHILVLRASQQDEFGTSTAGTLVVNPPQSRHTVHSGPGCVVLAIWEKPVVFAST